MKSDLVNGVPRDHYLVQIDGITTSEHLGFVEALKVSLKLRQQYPHSEVKVRETKSVTQAANGMH
jgi:hypothetical protein